MEDNIKNIIMTDLECRHRIVIPGYQGRCTYIFVFMDRKANTYFWVTGSPGPFTEGELYDIKAKLDTRDNRLSYVRPAPAKEVFLHTSEQVSKPDAEDIMLGLASY